MACRGKGTNWWYTSGDEPLEAARAVCEPYPIRRECLAYALESPELAGIWTGADERERRRMRRVSA
ncbi:MAG: WhiB family transcriptional regulator [Acidimicrobiales bacterium]